MKALPIVVAFAGIILLSCLPYAVLNGELFQSLVVALIYFLGFFGLYTMYECGTKNLKSNRWMVLIVAFLSVLIAHYSLEALLGGGSK